MTIRQYRFYDVPTQFWNRKKRGLRRPKTYRGLIKLIGSCISSGGSADVTFTATRIQWSSQEDIIETATGVLTWSDPEST